jgi:ribosomal protein L34E
MTHWKKLTNPNYLGAYSIENGQDLVLTIKYVNEETVIGTDGKKDNCVVCHFVENVKPMILNATNMKMITKLYKTPYIEDWAGKRIKIGIEKIKAFGEIVEALRIRKIVPQVQVAELPKCELCGNDIQQYSSMTSEQLAAYTKKQYGKQLCSACATKLAQQVATQTESEEESNNAVDE